jgi:hypothetical protein
LESTQCQCGVTCAVDNRQHVQLTVVNIYS